MNPITCRKYSTLIKAGHLVKQMRLYRQLTQSELAEKVGVTKMRISAIERSDDINFNTFRVICDELNFKLLAIPKENSEVEPLNNISAFN